MTRWLTPTYWKRCVPRVDDRLLKAVVYLFKNEHEASQGQTPGGSGFIVGERLPDTDEAVFLFAVTNEHVAHTHPVVRTAGTSPDRTHVRDAADWVRHRDGHDVAVTPLGLAPSECRDFKVDYIPREWFMRREYLRRPLNVEEGKDRFGLKFSPFGPGEQALMVGRFLPVEKSPENMPVVRFGNLASALTVKIRNDHRDLEQESFLVETRSINGFSGSPVFLYRDAHGLGSYPYSLGESSRWPCLLGVNWGHLNCVGVNDFVVDWSDERPERMTHNSGMALVVPAWTLAELLDSEEVSGVKDDWEERTREGTPSGTPDHLADEPDNKDPITRTEFLRDLDRATERVEPPSPEG